MSEAKMQVNLPVNGLIEQMKAMGEAAHQMALVNLRASMAYLGYTPEQYHDLHKALVGIQHHYLCDWAPIFEDVQRLLGVGIYPESIPAIIEYCKENSMDVSHVCRLYIPKMRPEPKPKPGTIAAYKRNKQHKYLWRI